MPREDIEEIDLVSLNDWLYSLELSKTIVVLRHLAEIEPAIIETSVSLSLTDQMSLAAVTDGLDNVEMQQLGELKAVAMDVRAR